MQSFDTTNYRRTTVVMTSEEQEQLQQTIEMFEVIIQSQPHDYQSLEILKEAYLKLGRDQEAIQTSRRIAEAYVEMGRLSSAMLEYETILHRFPEDQEVQMALQEIEGRAGSFSSSEDEQLEPTETFSDDSFAGVQGRRVSTEEEVDDGEAMISRLFVDGKHMSQTEFELCWPSNLVSDPGDRIVEPFLHHLDEKKIMPVEKSLKLLCDKARVGYLPLGLYDIHLDLSRTFSPDVCRRWCVLPIDQMSKAILVATTNPFNKRALQELRRTPSDRLIYYMVHPSDLIREIEKSFRK